MRTALSLLVVLACSACQAPGGPDYDKLPAVEVRGSGRYTTVLLKTRPGVRQAFSLSVPERPAAVVLYFRGATGIDRGTRWIEDGLQRHDIAIAVIDPPSDLPQGFAAGERSRANHVTDIDAVIRHLHHTLRVPVWLAGISMGSVSVANVGVNTSAGVQGVVFLSSITSTRFGRNSYGERLASSFALGELKVPVLALAHALDGCQLTPPSGAAEIVRRAARSPAREVKVFEGGHQFGRDPCLGSTYHVFSGIQPQVVDHIAAFIRKHSKLESGG